jgi:hypothetical protein
VSCNNTKHLFAHIVEDIIVGHVTRRYHSDSSLVEATLEELTHEARVLTGRHKNEHCVWLGVAGTLQKGRKVGIGEWRRYNFSNLSATIGEYRFEKILCLDART